MKLAMWDDVMIRGRLIICRARLSPRGSVFTVWLPVDSADLRLPAEQTMGMPETRRYWTTADVRALRESGVEDNTQRIASARSKERRTLISQISPISQKEQLFFFCVNL